MGGSFTPEQVAGMFRNEWQVWTGICIQNFIKRLILKKDAYLKPENLIGPVLVPGRPLFNNPPQLYIGKVVVDAK